MPKPPRKEALARIDEVLALMRDSFSPTDSIRYLLALVVLRWLADLTHGGYQLPYPLTLPDELEYHVPLSTPPERLPEWLNDMLSQLELLNKEELEGVFLYLNFKSPRFQFNQPGHGILGRAIDILWTKSHYRCSKELMKEALDIASTALMWNFNAPEFSTPDAVCSLASAILCPHHGESVYDPACGTGKMLVQCKKYLAGDAPAQWQMYGTEPDRTAWMLAKLNALSQGFSSRNIRWGDALRAHDVFTDEGRQSKFDVVVSHFSWSVKEWRDDDAPADPYARFRHGMPPKKNGDYAYLLHMASSMKAGLGRMLAVVSTGVLSRTGQEGRIRMRLVTDNLVDCVIALPDKMFQCTPIASAILVMRTDRASRRDVLFVDARGMAKGTRSSNTLSDDAVKAIARIYSTRAPAAGIAALASQDAIAANGYSLSVALYVLQQQEGEARDVAQVRGRRTHLMAELDGVNARIEQLLVPQPRDSPAPGFEHA